MDKEFYQIIYASAASAQFRDEELPELLQKARSNNAKLGITGMLLYHERSFIQVLTGPKGHVDALFQKIEKDPRHENTRVLFQGTVEERAFDEWTMGFYKTHAKSNEELPGFNNVMTHGFNDSDSEADRARQVLEAFRDGRWRQAVA